MARPTHHLTFFLLTLTVALLVLPSTFSTARPERIRPGVSYYSDEAICREQVCDIDAEKNYEEVYQLYSYFEAVYDDAERVIRFVEYRRDEPFRIEKYAQ